jgi:acyl carrier protein
MSEAEVRTAVDEALAEVQALGGHEAPLIKDALAPIGQLEGFDSLLSIEATVMIEKKLGCNLDTESIFISEDGARSLTVDQVVKRVIRITSESRS